MASRKVHQGTDGSQPKHSIMLCRSCVTVSVLIVLSLFSVTHAVHLRGQNVEIHESFETLKNTSMKPVFCMHGVTGSYHDFDTFIEIFKTLHPDQLFHTLNVYNGEASLIPLWTQVKGVWARIESIIRKDPDTYKDGYHLVCHSQGTLICRGILAYSSTHKVDTFIALTGPLMGEYGPYQFLQKMYPNVTVPNLWRILYTTTLQNTLSIANFWNDPHQRSAYLNDVQFLPQINNEIESEYNEHYRKNFIRTKKVAVFGSPDDEIILPWYSALFEYQNTDLERVYLDEMLVYVEDTFGLRTLNEEGRLQRTEVPNVAHGDWIREKWIIDTYIAPLLA